MIGFDEAQRLLAAAAAPLGVEQVALRQAHRRVLAEPVVAAVSSPPCDVSSMDGYAVRDHDLAALPVTLPVVGESFAGKGYCWALPAESCVRIFTGAPLPAGADRVVVQEVVGRDGDMARFEVAPGSARFIRRADGDFAAGDTLIETGSLLTPGALIAAAAADCARLDVFRRPLVRIIATGDELAEPGSARGIPGAVPDSVSIAVAALASDWGGDVVGMARLADDLPAMEHAAAAALKDADVIVVTGGASVGARDFAKAMFEGEGLKLIFSKVAIRPGKPVWLGRAKRRLVLGLPGNPTSALVTARLFLAPLLCVLTGRDPAEALAWRAMPLAHGLGPAGERETFARGAAEEGKARLFDFQESSAQKLLAAARLLVRRPAGDPPVRAGALVDVLDL